MTGIYRRLLDRIEWDPVAAVSTRLSLHPNTLRPQLRRLEEAGLVRREIRKGATVGRPQTMYVAVERTELENRDFRLLAEILAGVATGARARERASDRAREWGRYLAARGVPSLGLTLANSEKNRPSAAMR